MTTSHSGKHDLTAGLIRGHLIRMTLPMIWAMTATISFQLVDTYFVSRLGADALSAMSFTFPVTYGVFTLMMGVSIATSSVVSRAIGRRRPHRAQRIVRHALLMGLILGLLLAATGLLFLNPLFRALGAPPDLLPIIRSFMGLWFAGAVFVNVPLICNSAIRASGNTMLPAIVMTIAALANAALDPPLIFGLFGFPRLGVEGAALATVSSNACALFAGLYFLWRRGLLRIRPAPFALFADSAKRLLVIALPVGLTSVLSPLVSGILTEWLAQNGTASVAAYGIATRVEAFVFIAVIGLATGMSPVIGQNYGARAYIRVNETLRDALGFAALWSLLVAVILEAAAYPIAHLFSNDPKIIASTVLYFRIVPPTYLFGNLVPGWSSAFNAMGLPRKSLSMVLVRLLILTLPIAWLFNHYYGAAGIFAGVAAANVISGVAFHLTSRRYVRSLVHPLGLGVPA